MSFTTDEKSIIKLYSGVTPDRDRLLASMHQSLPHVDTPEIAELMNTVLRKVTAMTNADFAKIDLSNALDTISPEN